jgi:hypothetical protein
MPEIDVMLRTVLLQPRVLFDPASRRGRKAVVMKKIEETFVRKMSSQSAKVADSFSNSSFFKASAEPASVLVEPVEIPALLTRMSKLFRSQQLLRFRLTCFVNLLLLVL